MRYGANFGPPWSAAAWSSEKPFEREGSMKRKLSVRLGIWSGLSSEQLFFGQVFLQMLLRYRGAPSSEHLT